MTFATRGKKKVLASMFRGGDAFKIVLLASEPLSTDAVYGDLDEIPAGDGYAAGGLALTGGLGDFPSLTEGSGKAVVTLRSISWMALGGPIPVSGTFQYIALIDADDDLVCWWDIGSAESVEMNWEARFEGLRIEAE